MRTIKFRAKSLEGHNIGKWVFGDLHIRSVFPHIHTEVGTRCKIDPNTIGEFTGLSDKNGNDIYEGDVIGCHNPSIKHLIFYNEKQGRFMAALNGDTENDFVGVCGLDDSRWTGSKKVIGNIHDNPELLKEELEYD